MKTILFWITVMCCAVSANAAVKGVYVDYTVDGKEYQGYMAYNSEQQGLRPAVIVFPEWWGLNDYPKQRARELAGLGFVAFVADMYGKGVVTDKADEANKMAGAFYGDFSKFEKMTQAAFAEMLKQENVDTSKVAAIGFCFGGTCALELARAGADLSGCISFHGGLGTPTPEKAKNIKCPVLVLRGGSDPFDEEQYTTQFRTAMDEAGIVYKDVVYPDAKHAFTNPKADERGIDGVAYNAEAEKASMDEMRAFFREIFADGKE